MKVRALFSLAVAAGMTGTTATAFAADPPAPLKVAATNPNQTLADDVAYRLRSTGNASGADIRIVAQDGIVTLTGAAKDNTQRLRILADVKSVTGVVVVRENIRIPNAGVVQAQGPPVPLGADGLPVGAQPIPPGAAPLPTPAPIIEPAPLGAPGHAMPAMQAPNLPPYAWPTYAPYNNVSRVAYPEQYPYNAFPFIGPYYPFPKVPLGWRKVTLEWEDGHWYLGRNSTPHDYWRVRFW